MRLTRGSFLLLAVAAGPASAGKESHRSEAVQALPAPVRPACPDAGRAHVTLPDGLDGIDGFRVYVADAAPGAATDVTVLGGHHDRTLRAFAPGITTLSLDEPLRARGFDVALEPVLDAAEAACISRVELLRGGVVVGAAEIR